MNNEITKISIIAPCYNEEDVIDLFINTITSQMDKLNNKKYDYELICVDDGSKDKTLSIIKQTAASNNKIKWISFSRNFGKESAMLAGLQAADGECAIIMDADLQHPPELIPKMVTEYEKGYDQVIAKRSRKGESKRSIFFAHMYYKLVNNAVDVKIEDGAGDFRLLSRKAIEAMIRLQETNRFSKGLFSWIGFKRTTIDYENRERQSGTSKWSFKSLVKYGIDGIVSFNTQPLRVCITLGIALLIISILYLVFLLINIIMSGIVVPGYFTTIVLICMFGAIQLISLGIIGEYVGRIYSEVKRRPAFFVEESNIKNKQL